MKKIFIFIFLGLFLYILSFDNSYDLKIEFKIKNQNPKDINNNIAKNIEDELLKLQEIKDLVIFSSIYGCNIYCKFKKFALKNETISKIERRLNYLGYKNYQINDRYNFKYQYFIVVTSKNNDYYLLKDKADKIYDKLLNFKPIKDIKLFGAQQKTNYIYFSSSDLLNYSIDIEEIKNKIKNFNNKQNLLSENKNEYFYPLKINSKIESVENIKNIPLEYKNSNFFSNFGSVFKIEKTTQHPKESEILYNNQTAIVLGISNKIYYPKFLLNQILKNENVKIISPNRLKRVEIYLNDNSNINSGMQKAKEMQKNLNSESLFFIGLSSPKTNSKEYFDEIFKNRIIAYVNPFEKINFKKEKTKIAPQKISAINYEINDYELSRLKLAKKEILNSFLASNGGLFCDYYFEKKDKIEIFLKNQDKEFYSKKLQTIIPKDSIVKSTYISQYVSIARKNGKYIEIKQVKNPFKIKGVQFQIRYLLSL